MREEGDVIEVANDDFAVARKLDHGSKEEKREKKDRFEPRRANTSVGRNLQSISMISWTKRSGTFASNLAEQTKRVRRVVAFLGPHGLKPRNPMEGGCVKRNSENSSKIHIENGYSKAREIKGRQQNREEAKNRAEDERKSMKKKIELFVGHFSRFFFSSHRIFDSRYVYATLKSSP